ncbi:uncharacterized protein si:zfos-464b6.2 [Hoplias malabaricus]|uniref:uncharacterized protein si:zfos-464b6.2 n=1 Tax=Hoplias malabaricus TaxID=27720 RepID=UPI003462EE3E
MSISGQQISPQSRTHFVPKNLGVLLFLCLFILVFILYYITNNATVYKRPILYPAWIHTEPRQLACGLPVQSDPIIKVNGRKAYTVGSYIEHRFGRKIIRTIGIMLRSEDNEYTCLLCCNNQTVSVTGSYKIHSDHFGYDYGTVYIDCEIPATCSIPTHIAITSEKHEEKTSSWNIQFFQPVRNHKTKENFTYNFTVCISVMYEFKDVLALVQAMEMYKILGIRKVAIYKTSCDPHPQMVLDYYVKQGFVDIIPWTVTSYITVSRGWQKHISPGELHYFGQIAALNDCVYRYMYQSRYVALHDMDELILPLKEDNWTELLPRLEKIYQNTAGFEFENNYFPLSISTNQKPEYAPDLWKQVEGTNFLQHTKRLINDPSVFNNFKVIVNPRSVYKATVHGILESRTGTVRVDHNIARMYHMRNISHIDLSGTQDTRLWDFANKLIPAVSEVLKKVFNIQ